MREAAAAPQDAPTVLQRGEGPLRDLDLLAIGVVLAAVIAVHAVRRLVRKRHDP